VYRGSYEVIKLGVTVFRTPACDVPTYLPTYFTKNKFRCIPGCVFSKVTLILRSFSSVCSPFCMKFLEHIALYMEALPTWSDD
jgi:hypothetical protein